MGQSFAQRGFFNQRFDEFRIVLVLVGIGESVQNLLMVDKFFGIFGMDVIHVFFLLIMIYIDTLMDEVHLPRQGHELRCAIWVFCQFRESPRAVTIR